MGRCGCSDDWRPGPRRPAGRRRPASRAGRRLGRCPSARRLIGRCGSGWGRRGLGLALRGGCGPASPPPPRDYLVPAAAMSPGRNVPPQIMLFISLGGSVARQHQAPGGRCTRSPALPSSPCAAAAATPGLGLAVVTAPAQVSPGRARQPEGVGFGCGCARLGRAARAQRRRWAQGARDARGSGDRMGDPASGVGRGGGAGPGGPGG